MKKEPEKKTQPISRNIRVAVAFGDMRGSNVWLQRVNNQGLEYRTLMDKIDERISELKSTSKHFVKRMGDGFLIILNMDHASSLEVAEFLMVLWDFKERAVQWIKDHPNPRPGGFRIRAACGYVEEKLHGKDEIDYRGYHIGMASKLLRVDKRISFICHQSIKEILTPHHVKSFGFVFKKMRKPRLKIDGVFEADMKELFAFNIKKNELNRRSIKEARP